MYWKVEEPMAEARLTISGKAMVKHSDEAWNIMIEKPSSDGRATRRAWGRIT
ncbi:hypothetical protein D3C76_1582690 [compost metagenome]